jgi:hypothetical protein
MINIVITRTVVKSKIFGVGLLDLDHQNKVNSQDYVIKLLFGNVTIWFGFLKFQQISKV